MTREVFVEALVQRAEAAGAEVEGFTREALVRELEAEFR